MKYFEETAVKVFQDFKHVEEKPKRERKKQTPTSETGKLECPEYYLKRVAKLVFLLRFHVTY